MDDETTRALWERLQKYRRNLNHLLNQVASAGSMVHASLQLFNDVNDTREEIAIVKRKLRALGMEVEDLPDDTEEPSTSPGTLDPKRERMLRALLHDHSAFMQSRLDSFVGRADELAEVQRRIAELLPSGGYLMISGQAGQGKSSLIARLVERALRERCGAGAPPGVRELVEQAGPAALAYHFIPFSPGPDHQVGLLRNLMARLILRYNLPEFYVVSESRPALRDYFARMLEEIAQCGGREVIFIDGLDQIEQDASGVRDLSFLPTRPPAGIVFVLGTRPDETLKPLELRKPCYEYKLPALSRADFDLVLQHRGVALEEHLAERFYAAMGANALYLDLVARELTEQGALPPEQIIAQIADDPDNLFSFAIDRLQRTQLWDNTIYPILGLLLATREPLHDQALRILVGQSHMAVQQALQHLGGLITRDGDGRVSLFHLKLRDFLREDPRKAAKCYIFAADEEQRYHQKLADWCERGGLDSIWEHGGTDVPERERRAYARQHYVTHLCRAGLWERLWAVLDAGDYGRAKLRHDPSTRGFVLDLDTVRQAMVAATRDDFKRGVAWLPRLWRYSLLRCSLSSQADRYPDRLIALLARLGREQEAIGLAELLTDPVRKVQTLARIGVYVGEQNNKAQKQQVLMRSRNIATQLKDPIKQAQSLLGFAIATSDIEMCKEIIRNTKHNTDASSRLGSLVETMRFLVQNQQFNDTEIIISEAIELEGSVTDPEEDTYFLNHIARLLTQIGQYDRATQLALKSAESAFYISDINVQIQTLIEIIDILDKNQDHRVALRLSQKVLDIIYTSEDESTKPHHIAHLIQTLSQSNNTDEVIKFIDSIAEDYTIAPRYPYKDFILPWSSAAIADILARNQQYERALEIVHSITDAYVKALTFLSISEHLALNNHINDVSILIQESSAIADELESEHENAQLLMMIIRVLAITQQAHLYPKFVHKFINTVDKAEEIEDDDKLTWFTDIATLLADVEQLQYTHHLVQKAIWQVRRSSHFTYDLETRSCLIDILIEHQRFDKAFVVADTIAHTGERTRKRRVIQKAKEKFISSQASSDYEKADIFTDEDAFHLYLQIYDHTSSQSTNNESSTIKHIETIITSRQYEEAISLINTISNIPNRFGLFYSIYKETLPSKEAYHITITNKTVFNNIKAISDTESRIPILQRFVRLFCDNDLHQEIITIINTLDNNLDRFYANISVIWSLTSKCQLGQAVDLLGEVFAVAQSLIADHDDVFKEIVDIIKNFPHLPTVLTIVQQLWEQTTRRDHLYALLPATAPLLLAHEELLPQLLDGDAWVKAQLAW